MIYYVYFYDRFGIDEYYDFPTLKEAETFIIKEQKERRAAIYSSSKPMTYEELFKEYQYLKKVFFRGLK